MEFRRRFSLKKNCTSTGVFLLGTGFRRTYKIIRFGRDDVENRTLKNFRSWSPVFRVHPVRIKHCPGTTRTRIARIFDNAPIPRPGLFFDAPFDNSQLRPIRSVIGVNWHSRRFYSFPYFDQMTSFTDGTTLVTSRPFLRKIRFYIIFLIGGRE